MNKQHLTAPVSFEKELDLSTFNLLSCLEKEGGESKSANLCTQGSAHTLALVLDGF